VLKSARVDFRCRKNLWLSGRDVCDDMFAENVEVEVAIPFGSTALHSRNSILEDIDWTPTRFFAFFVSFWH
jgi:hypothetical protein